MITLCGHYVMIYVYYEAQILKSQTAGCVIAHYAIFARDIGYIDEWWIFLSCVIPGNAPHVTWCLYLSHW